jgi:hypothetical protein
MKLELADFEIEHGHSARSEALRHKMKQVCDTVHRSAARVPNLKELVYATYVGREKDHTSQWFCFLPGDADMKTDLIHAHVVLPQNGRDEATPWMGLNVEFNYPRLPLRDVLRNDRKRRAVIDALGAVEDLVLFLLDKWTRVETDQMYRWDWDSKKDFPGCGVDDALLRDIEKDLAADARPAPEPGWKINPAIVMGWFFTHVEMVGWGDRLSDEILARLKRLEPLWRLLARN